MAAPDNANPTFLSLSQLPSRIPNGKVRHGVGSKYDHILFPAAATAWPSDEEDDRHELDDEPIDEQDIYDLISTLTDPEHPLTLGQLSVVNLGDIHVNPSPAERLDPDALTTVLVELTPTVDHCSLAAVLGLAVRSRLEGTLPPNYRVDVRIKKGTYNQDVQVNKQLSDKERVAAALENETLNKMILRMLEGN